MFSRALVFSLLIAIAMVSISMAVVVLGIYGGTSFQAVGNRLLSRNNGSQAQNLQKPCDVDSDGDCDSNDYGAAMNFLGGCVGRKSYRQSLDVDKDGCITEDDLQKLFPSRR